MSSFHGVGIERFHCIQRCPHFRGVGIEGFHCIQRCPHFRMWLGRNSGVLHSGV